MSSVVTGGKRTSSVGQTSPLGGSTPSLKYDRTAFPVQSEVMAEEQCYNEYGQVNGIGAV